jgi:ribonuclease BN (tRNA processing enzyme)
MSANMKAAGIDPNAVDIVLISHFHGDHIGGLRTADGKLTYPNAEIMVPAPEWAFWTDEANVAKANGFNKGNFPTVKKVFDGLGDKVTKFEYSGTVPAQSGLACGVRQRSRTRAGNAPQVLRHGVGRQDRRRGLSLLVPVARPCREGRRRLPADPGGVESGNLKTTTLGEDT